MTKYTYFPKRVKILEVYNDWQWGRYQREIIGHTWIIVKYYVAEHSKTDPLKKGDSFIIKEKYDKYGR